jgi:SAM-dependent methyltransferase
VLPFESGSFDVVILNHVITYIPDQLSALLEIRRVLKPGGICYIALPNKLFPRDPHSKFLFVHYLPRALYQNFLNWLTGAKEDVIMHTPKGMTKLFKEANFSWEDYTVDILHDPDGFHSGTRLKFPSWRWLTIISPSNVFVLKAEM